MTGVYLTRSGLFCRFPGCEACFRSDGSVAGIRDSAAMRDEHELGQHGYSHQVVPIQHYAAANLGRLSTRGRSTLSLHKKGELT